VTSVFAPATVAMSSHAPDRRGGRETEARPPPRRSGLRGRARRYWPLDVVEVRGAGASREPDVVRRREGSGSQRRLAGTRIAQRLGAADGVARVCRMGAGLREAAVDVAS
jgi:hypothetical protein